MTNQDGRNAKGQFAPGNKGKPRGAKSKRKGLDPEKIAGQLGGKGGVSAYIKTRLKLLDDMLLVSARAKAAAPVDASGNAIVPTIVQNVIPILMVPNGMRAIPASLGGGYCCSQLVVHLIAEARAGRLGPFGRSEDDAKYDSALTKAVPYEVPQPFPKDVAEDLDAPPPRSRPFLRVHDPSDDDGGVPPAA